MAVLLDRFRIRLASEEATGASQFFPSLDRKKRSLGIIDPVKGNDIALKGGKSLER